MLPLVLALLFSATPSDALLEMTRSLGAAGVLPKTDAELQEIAVQSLSPAFQRAADAPLDVERWSSEDERCFAEFGPAAKIAYGCRFASAVEAGTFLDRKSVV